MLTLSHGSKYIKIHDPAALWIKSVSTSGFEACVREAGSGSGGASVISWLAFQGSYDGIHSGIVGFDEFTSRTQCKQISLGSQTKVSYDLDHRENCEYGNYKIRTRSIHVIGANAGKYGEGFNPKRTCTKSNKQEKLKHN